MLISKGSDACALLPPGAQAALIRMHSTQDPILWRPADAVYLDSGAIPPGVLLPKSCQRSRSPRLSLAPTALATPLLHCERALQPATQLKYAPCSRPLFPILPAPESGVVASPRSF